MLRDACQIIDSTRIWIAHRYWKMEVAHGYRTTRCHAWWLWFVSLCLTDLTQKGCGPLCLLLRPSCHVYFFVILKLCSQKLPYTHYCCSSLYTLSTKDVFPDLKGAYPGLFTKVSVSIRDTTLLPKVKKYKYMYTLEEDARSRFLLFAICMPMQPKSTHWVSINSACLWYVII